MPTIKQRVTAVLEAAVGRDLSSRERHNFLPSVENNRALSARQETWLLAIEARLGLVNNEDREEEQEEEEQEDDTLPSS